MKMPFFLDTQEAAQRFGGQIAEFGALLDVNHVRHGSPNDLVEFVRAIDHSQQLRGDLSALVQSVVRRAHEEILLTDMMGILAAAVGGPSIAETRMDITGPTNALMEFLLGTGCWRNFGSPAPAFRSERPLRPSVRGEDWAEPRNSAATAEAAARGKSEDKESLLEISNELRQTLSRLESSAMQVKLHLDSIEQRIAKAEMPPRWEAPPLEPLRHVDPALELRHVDPTPEWLRQTAPTVEPLLGRTAPAPFVDKVVRFPAEDRVAPEPALPTRGRAIFSQFLPEEEQTEEGNFSSPTFAYAAEGEKSRRAIGVFVAVLVVLAACFFFAYSRYGRGVLASGVAHGRVLFGSRSAPVTPPPAPAAAIMPASEAPAAAGKGSSASPVNESGASAAPAASATGPNGVSPAPSDVVGGRLPAAGAASGSSGIRYVSANVMEGRLLSAPRPEYPASARLNRIEGQVALQATVSKSGSVIGLHVVKGPLALRRAALGAVRQWKYRPFVVDGRPMDVSTMVYVDFALRASPTIVH